MYFWKVGLFVIISVIIRGRIFFWLLRFEKLF